MNKIYSAIILLTIAIVNSGCPKPCIEANYSFAVNSQFIPDLDSVHTGDTVYLTSTFPTTLRDQSTLRLVDYSNSTNIGSDLGLVKLVKGTSTITDAVDEFNYLSIVGTIYNDINIASPNKFQQLRYQ